MIKLFFRASPLSRELLEIFVKKFFIWVMTVVLSVALANIKNIDPDIIPIIKMVIIKRFIFLFGRIILIKLVFVVVLFFIVITHLNILLRGCFYDCFFV